MVQRCLAFGILLALAFGLSTRSPGQCVVGTNAALSFDGSTDIVYVPTNAALGGWNDFTIELFMKSTQSSAGSPYLLSKFRGLTPLVTDDVFTVRLNPSGALYVQLSSVTSYTVFHGSTPINNGQWRHVAIRRVGTIVDLIVDGAVDGGGTFAGPLNVTSTPLTMGNGLLFATETPDPAGWFAGTMDEVRIWHVARTQAQIQSTMTVGLTGNEPGLLGYWRFDEAPGQQTVFNSATVTGSALDGTLGANALPGTDDPTRITTGLPPIPYCAPCPAPPCGQLNSACASLLVNGVGANAQGPLAVSAPAGTMLSLAWSGPANQPLAFVATPVLVPGQHLGGGLVVDVNFGTFVVAFSGFDPLLGPLFWTNGVGTATQAFGVPPAANGGTLSCQGVIFDTANTCSGGVGFMTTASFVIQF